MNLKKNVIWNTVGTMSYLGAQWLTTVLVFVISGKQADAAYYSLAMSISNVFHIIAIYNVRNYQVSDINNEYSNADYLFHRISAMAIAFLSGAIFIGCVYHEWYVICILILYMIFRMGEALVDVLHGMDQKQDRMDIVGKSFVLRGIALLLSFVVSEYLFGNILIAFFAMTLSTYSIIFLYDIKKAKSITTIKLEINKNKIKEIYAKCFPMLVYGIALNLAAAIPRIVFEKIMGEDLLGYYASVATPAVIVQSFASVIFAPFITIFTVLYSEKRRKEYINLASKMVLFCVFLGVISYVGSACFGEYILDKILYAGKGIGPYCYLLNDAMIYAAMVAIIWFLSILLTIDRAYLVLTISTIMGALVSLVSSYIMIRWYKLDGINYALIISYIVIIVIMILGLLIRLKKHFISQKGN